jgi:hypothetical protein
MGLLPGPENRSRNYFMPLFLSMRIRVCSGCSGDIVMPAVEAGRKGYH